MSIVYIPLEVTRRELDSKILLACNLVHNGTNVIIGNKSNVYRFLEKAPEPGLMFYKSSSPAPLERFKNELGHKFFGQDEEAGILFPFEHFYDSRGTAIDMADKTDRYFVWSQEEFDFLVEKLQMRKQNIVNSGGIRTVLWGSNGLIFYQEKVDYLQKKFGRYILFILTEPIATIFSQSIYKFSDYEIQVDKFINMLIINVIELILISTNLNVVIRPHPVGISDFWRKYFKKYPRVIISDEETLSSWILGSYCVIHDGSTGGFESAVSDIPTIYIERNHFISNENKLINNSRTGNISLKPKSMTELLEILENPKLSWSKQKQERKKIIKEYLTNASNVKVIKIITKEILKESNATDRASTYQIKRDLKSEIHFNFMYRIPKILLKNPTFFMERHKRPRITKKMIEEKCSRSQAVLSIPSETKIKIRQIGFSTFLLSASDKKV